MSISVSVKVVTGVRLEIEATDFMEEYPAIEGEPDGLALYYDDETSTYPILGKEVIGYDEPDESGIYLLRCHDRQMIADHIAEALGYDVSPTDIHDYFLILWG